MSSVYNSCEPRKSKGPVLRLFMKSPTLEMIPNSPSPNNTYPIPRQSPKSDVLFTQCSVMPDEDLPLYNKSSQYSYNITSLSSLRKQKMDRLRKKLGQEVPFELVFPSSSDSEPEQSITPILPSSIKECTVLLPPPTPRPRKDTGRLSSARDSIVGCTSVHHAKRQSVTKQNLTHSPTKSELESKRLSFIIESPDEHGVGCAQEPRVEQSADFRSEWSAGTEVKLWSTRRGYEGWRPDSPSKASQSPSTTSSSLPPSPSNSVISNSELKKKPSSYRKPVPRLLE